MKYIAIEYGEDIFDKLKLFGGRKLLLNYISHSYRINQRSKETVTMKPELRDFFFNEYKFGFDQNVQLNMDHILYNFMRHDAISLANVVNYEITKDTPVNLKSSYDKSVKIAKKLHDVDGSLAWFVNQRIPKTYIEASSVIDTLERSFEIYYKNPNIDVRRIHLFYKKYLTYDMSSKIPYMNTKALFNTLLLEYMHGVNSKVLCIEDYDMVSKILFKNGNDIANNHLFLLDFALYYSKSGSSTDSKKDYLSGEPHILCADFTADDPDEKMKTPEQEFSFRQKEYERNKVYVFDSPIIYSVFKNYFLSLWNLEKYICYLTYHIQGKENWEYYAELDKLNKTLEGGIKVYNFIQFWQMAEKSFGTSTLFDHKIFESNYLWGESDCKDKIIKDIQDILNSFDIRGSFRESNEVTFTKLTDALGDHIKRKIYLCQNYS